MKLGARIAATAATLTVAGTYVAAQIDYARRHRPGIAPETYLVPQITQVWLPGISAAALFAVVAFVMHRRQRT